MSEKLFEFEAVIQKHGRLDAAFVEFPYNVEGEFGTRAQVKVVATFDGQKYHGSLARMGHPCHFIGLTKEVRNSIGKGPGDTVHVTIRQDTEPREVNVPDDFRRRLAADVEAAKAFEGLSYSNQREYVRWITEAKKVETRDNRIGGAIVSLREGKKRP